MHRNLQNGSSGLADTVFEIAFKNYNVYNKSSKLVHEGLIFPIGS